MVGPGYVSASVKAKYQEKDGQDEGNRPSNIYTLDVGRKTRLAGLGEMES